MSQEYIIVDTTQKDMRVHGDIEYPIGIYYADFSNLYLGVVRWHWHKEVEFSIIKEGSVDFLIGNQTIRLNKGDGIFLNEGVPHSIHSAPGNELSPITYTIIFNHAFLFGYGQTYMSAKYIAPIVNQSSMRYVLFSEKNPEDITALSLGKEIIIDNFDKIYGYELRTKGRLCMIWDFLIQKITDKQAFTECDYALSMEEARVKDAISFIEKRYADSVTLDQIADSIHVSKSECCRTFKKVTRMSPIVYVMRYRIFESTKRLQHPDTFTSISELAASVGFSNTSYFNKVFKLYLGYTPSQYRANIKAGFTNPTGTSFGISPDERTQ